MLFLLQQLDPAQVQSLPPKSWMDLLGYDFVCYNVIFETYT